MWVATAQSRSPCPGVSLRPRAARRHGTGTDTLEAIINAGAAAVAGAKRYLWFAGNGAVCCAFALQTAGVGDRSFFTAAVGTWQMAVLGTIWIGANTRGVFTDTAGRRVQKAIVPQRMPGAPPPKRTLIGRKHLKRFMATTEPNVMVTGDSLSTPDPNFQCTAFAGRGSVRERLREDNPDKTINTILRGIGGSQVGWLASSTPPAARLQFSHAGQPWFTDRTLPWWHYVESAVVNGSTITPDTFFLSFGGYNDTNSLHPLKLQALINRIAALPQRGGLPPDCLLSTCMVKTPGTAYIQDSLGDTQRLLRTMAAHQGLGLIDYDPHSSLQAFGTSTEHVALRLIPGFTADFSPSAPITLNTHCNDYSVQLRMNSANGAVAWKAVGSLTFSLSPQPGNVMIVDTDPATGVLRYEARLWGRAVQTTVTVSGTTLKTSPGTGFTGTLNWIGTTTQCELGPSPGPFTGTVGQCALLPGADTFGGTMRTFVNTVVSDSVAVMDDFLFNVRAAQAGQTRYSSSCEAVIGGMMFVPLDADAQVDVVIPGAGVAGGEYRGKIVGYTDANQVTISPAVSTTLTAASVALFLGRISVPKTTTTIAATTDRGRWAANPIVDFSVQGGRLQLRYQPPRQVNIQGTYRAFIGTVERFGGRFCPTITPSATGPASITVANVFVDDQMLYMPEATPWELHSAGSRYYQYGGGGAHSSSLLAERVATRVLNAQDFAA